MRRRLSRSLPLALAFLVVAAGCGDDDPDTEAVTSASVEADSGASAGPPNPAEATTTTLAPCVPQSPIAGRAQPAIAAKATPGPDEVVKTTEIPGTGRAAAQGDTITLNYSGWVADGANTALFDDTWSKGRFASFVVGQDTIAGFGEGLEGVQPGERRTIVIGANKAFMAEAPEAQPGYSAIPPNAALAFTVDIASVVPASIEGRLEPSTEPVQAPEGKDALQISTVIEGEGTPIVAGDTVVAQFVVWLADGNTTELLESTWTKDAPVQITVNDPTATPGLAKGLAGAKPGERRRIVFGSDLGFGDEGVSDPAVPGGAALVYEVDVYGVIPGC
jgi:peptidylprolyl isomerase